MTTKWNPKTALRRAVPFFQDLAHITQIHIATCGGEGLLIYFDPDTSELVAETDDGVEIGRACIEVNP